MGTLVEARKRLAAEETEVRTDCKMLVAAKEKKEKKQELPNQTQKQN